MRDHQDGRDRRAGLREEQAERQDQLGDEVPDDLDPVDRARQVVEEPRQRVRHRLGLVMPVHAGQAAPARIAAELDEPGAELDAEGEPAEQEDDREQRRRLGIAEEDRQETGLEQQRLPAERVPRPADVHDRGVERPEHEPGEHRDRQRRLLRESQQERGGDDHADPGDDAQPLVGVPEVEDARRPAERGGRQQVAGRLEPTIAAQRRELVERDEERDQVQRGQSPFEHEPRELVVGGGQVGHLNHHTRAGMTSGHHARRSMLRNA